MSPCRVSGQVSRLPPHPEGAPDTPTPPPPPQGRRHCNPKTNLFSTESRLPAPRTSSAWSSLPSLQHLRHGGPCPSGFAPGEGLARETSLCEGWVWGNTCEEGSGGATVTLGSLGCRRGRRAEHPVPLAGAWLHRPGRHLCYEQRHPGLLPSICQNRPALGLCFLLSHWVWPHLRGPDPRPGWAGVGPAEQGRWGQEGVRLSAGEVREPWHQPGATQCWPTGLRAGTRGLTHP